MENLESRNVPKNTYAADEPQKRSGEDNTNDKAGDSSQLGRVDDNSCGAAAEDKPTESEKTFRVDYTFVDTEDRWKDCVKKINSSNMLAVDCEGDNLCRHGKLQLLSIATETTAFLIDISALKFAPFETGLREILETKQIKKLMFDCREDSDALFHQFHVKLDGILDMQLLEVIKRQEKEPKSRIGRRCDRHDEVVRVKGLLDCIETHVDNKAIHEIKKRGSRLQEKWGERPLPTEALEYAATDVLVFFKLLDKLQPDAEEMKRLEIASDIYADLKRSKAVRTNDMYERNGYLPIDVIPEKGQTSFKRGFTTCTECCRDFPREEFSNNQLSLCTQKCRTCKRVKNDHDVHKNRMDNKARWQFFNYYDSDSSDDYLYGYNYYYDSDSSYYCDS